MYIAACDPSAACEKAATRERRFADRTLQRTLPTLHAIITDFDSPYAASLRSHLEGSHHARIEAGYEVASQASRPTRLDITKADAAVVYHASPSNSQAGSLLPYPKWSAQSLRACSLTLKRPHRCHAADTSATPKLRPRL